MAQQLRDSRGALAAVDERSTIAIRLVFADGDGGAISAVVSSAWSLVDADGAIINGREGEALSISASAATVVLTDADLALAGVVEAERRVTVSVVYNSATYGDGIRLTAEFAFLVRPLAGVPAGG